MRSDRNWTMATVKATRDVAIGIREFLLEPESGATSYPTGSHLAVRVLIDGKTDLRHYSLIGDEPRDNCWRIAVKREEPGRGGSQYMWSLQPGARLEVASPDTHFELSRDPREFLLIAGGIGITPLVGMAHALMKRNAKFRFVYAARSREHMAFIDELGAALGDRLELFSDADGQKLDLATEFARLDKDAEVYVCGPLGLLEGCRKAWAATGRPRSKLVYETFGSSGRFASESFVVRVPRFNAEVVVPENVTMLDALEAAGVHLLHDCRRGECGLCVVDIVETNGTVDHRDVFFSDEQHEENHRICACVSRVVGGSITIDPAYRGDQPLRSGPEIKAMASA
jgi:ferredoxin-NADP reductase